MSTKKDANLGARIREYRKTKKLTLQELGEKIGVTHGSLSCIENGKTLPQAQTLQGFCEYTDINIRWLLTGKGPMIEEPATPAQPPQMTLPSFLWALAEWATEMSGSEGFAWLQKQLDICLPTFKMWREQKSAEGALHQNQVTKKVA